MKNLKSLKQQGSVPQSSVKPNPHTNLNRSLGTIDGVALLIGITIGLGIFTTPSLVAGYLDSFSSVMMVWIGIGMFMIMGGLIYAELGTRLPVTGGEYVYITKCFGPLAGFMLGWAQLFIIRTSPAAAVAIISADYLGVMIDLSPMAHTSVALGIIVFVGAINYLGITWASLFQKFTVVAKVGFIASLVLLGLAFINRTPNLLGSTSPVTEGLGPIGNVTAAVILIIFSHTGWDRVGCVAEEMKDPRKVIPRTMLFGMSTVLVLYWSINTMYHYILGIEGMRDTITPAADMADIVIGPIAANFVALMIILSAIGGINGTAMSATRVYYSMAKDGIFFSWLNYIHPKFKTPSRAIIIYCAWTSFLILFRGSFENIAGGMVFAILIFYIMTTAAFFKIRIKNIGEPGAFRIPFYPWLPCIYLIGIVGLVVLRAIYQWEQSLIDLAILTPGLPISYIWLSKKKKEHHPEI